MAGGTGIGQGQPATGTATDHRLPRLPPKCRRAHSGTTLHKGHGEEDEASFHTTRRRAREELGVHCGQEVGSPGAAAPPKEAGAWCSHATPPPRHNIKVTRAFLGQSPGDLGGEPEVSKLAGLKKKRKEKKPQNDAQPASGSAGEAGSLTEGGGGGCSVCKGKLPTAPLSGPTPPPTKGLGWGVGVRDPRPRARRVPDAGSWVCWFCFLSGQVAGTLWGSLVIVLPIYLNEK